MGPPGVYRNREGLAGASGFKQGVSQPGSVVALKIKCLANTRALCRPRGCDGFRQ
jgi:hypothetical protein